MLIDSYPFLSCFLHSSLKFLKILYTPQINNIPFTIAKPSSSPTIVIYGKLRARELQHHLQKRHHIEQRKENFFTIAKPSSSPTTFIYGKLRAKAKH
ncbi:unnamed protein product [Gordionus sp. m RMFG-2023]